MHKLAVRVRVKVELSSRVVSYNVDDGSITLQNGKKATADLIVAADGVKSTARMQVLYGADQQPQRTGFAGYRAVVDINRRRADPGCFVVIREAIVQSLGRRQSTRDDLQNRRWKVVQHGFVPS